MSSHLNKYIENLEQNKGVRFLSKPENQLPFEKAYLDVREKEDRLYEDRIVKELPHGDQAKPLHEWKMRARSANRVFNYFQKSNSYLKVLDLGCGNGWFTSYLSKSSDLELYGLDVNLKELEQAARVFPDRITFIYGDIFKMDFPKDSFNAITINAAVQYFPDLNKLLEHLFSFMPNEGEVHIIDSPFYSKHEAMNARERSVEYYKSVGVAEMENYYFHHCLEDINDYEIDFLFDPGKIGFMKKLFKEKEIPFPWLRIKHK